MKISRSTAVSIMPCCLLLLPARAAACLPSAARPALPSRHGGFRADVGAASACMLAVVAWETAACRTGWSRWSGSWRSSRPCPRASGSTTRSGTAACGSGVYAPTPPHDPQGPHDQDELYIVIAGSGTFVKGDERRAFGPGDVIFVEAGVPHRFEEFGPDFATWVVFWGPPGGEAATEAPRQRRARAGRTGVTLPSPTWLVDRILYRDGADPDHRQAGRRAGACRAGRRGQSRALFRGAAVRPAAAAGAGASARPRHQRLPRARPPSQGAVPRWAGCSQAGRSRRSTGRWSAAARRQPRGPDRAGAEEALGAARLVDAGRSGRAGRHHRLPRPGRGGRAHLAGMPAADRADAPDPGALRRAGLPGAGRSDLWRRHPPLAGRRCTCMRARSACRSIRTARRSPPPPHRRRICWRRCADAAMVQPSSRARRRWQRRKRRHPRGSEACSV